MEWYFNILLSRYHDEPLLLDVFPANKNIYIRYPGIEYSRLSSMVTVIWMIKSAAMCRYICDIGSDCSLASSRNLPSNVLFGQWENIQSLVMVRKHGMRLSREEMFWRCIGPPISFRRRVSWWDNNDVNFIVMSETIYTTSLNFTNTRIFIVSLKMNIGY